MMKICSNYCRKIGLDEAIFYGFSSIFLQVLKAENLNFKFEFQNKSKNTSGECRKEDVCKI